MCSLLFIILNMAACSGNAQSEQETSPTTRNRKMNIQVNGHVLTATLVDNSSTAALLEQLAKGTITYEAHDYGNFEKVGDIGIELPQNNTDITTQPGDIILYQGRNICIYYDRNRWNFTRIGKIDNITRQKLMRILGTGNCTVTLSLPPDQ